MASKAEEIKIIADDIRQRLIANETYSELLEPSIEDAAQIRYLKNQAFEAIKTKKDYIAEEVTREGNIKLKQHPKMATVMALYEASRKALIELGMTARSSSANEDDELGRLSKQVESERRDE